jgi:HB1, ASXL, restriction endonuclease HTH domain
MMTMTEAAEIVLRDLHRPLHARELVTEIEKRGLFKFGAKKPDSVLAQALSQRSSTFTKTAPGTYELKK